MPDKPTGKRLKRIRIFFVLLFPFLFFQLWFAMKVEEPFPAVLMLVFGGVDGTDGNYYSMVQDIRSYQHGEYERFTRDDLMPDMLFPLRYHAMEYTFGHKTRPEKWQDPALIEWLNTRITPITGQSAPDSMVIRWNKQTFQVEEGVASRQEATIAKFVIPLR